MLASIPAILPVSLKDKNTHQVTSSFGYRMHPIYKTPEIPCWHGLHGYHRDPIYATGNGVVIESKFDKGYGRHVVIDHGFSYKTLYAHMDKILAKKGQKTNEGTLSDI